MTDDLLQWAGSSGVGDGGQDPTTNLVQFAEILPPPEVRAAMKKSRSRPNRGRKRRYIGPLLETPPWDILRETGYPIPPDVKCISYVPSCWRRGPEYVVWRARVHAMWGTTCHLCKHDGAHTADHLVPLSKWGNQPYDPRLSRPAHGIEGCPVCGIKCNSSRGNRALAKEVGSYQPPIAM